MPLSILAGFLVGLPLTSAQTTIPQERPPNIVLLLADDAGFADFGFQDAPDPDLASLTPHIDSIAHDGVRFTDFYVSGCVCSPSRAGLLTGRYQQRFGHETNIPPGYMDGGLALEERTVADRLRGLGYRTACIGKWHLGYPEPFHPNERGFDVFYGCLQGSRSYYPMKNPTPHRVLLDNRTPTAEGGYITDRLGEAAVRFIGENRQRPFLLYLSFTAPHGPLEPRPEDLPALESIEKKKRRRYAGLVKALDDNVGLVLEALERNGLADDTLVIFTNDNGGQTQTGAINTPLKGRKGMLLEGGIRVPCGARWPGHVEPGRVANEPVIALDLLPTFVTLAGGQLDEAWNLDGRDIVDVLCGPGDPGLQERPLFWRHGGPGGDGAVRLGHWKLHWPERANGTAAALYDLSNDIGETEDLSAQHPEILARLVALFHDWERALVDPRWGQWKQRRGV